MFTAIPISGVSPTNPMSGHAGVSAESGTVSGDVMAEVDGTSGAPTTFSHLVASLNISLPWSVPTSSEVVTPDEHRCACEDVASNDGGETLAPEQSEDQAAAELLSWMAAMLGIRQPVADSPAAVTGNSATDARLQLGGPLEGVGRRTNEANRWLNGSHNFPEAPAGHQASAISLPDRVDQNGSLVEGMRPPGDGDDSQNTADAASVIPSESDDFQLGSTTDVESMVEDPGSMVSSTLVTQADAMSPRQANTPTRQNAELSTPERTSTPDSEITAASDPEKTPIRNGDDGKLTEDDVFGDQDDEPGLNEVAEREPVETTAASAELAASTSAPGRLSEAGTGDELRVEEVDIGAQVGKALKERQGNTGTRPARLEIQLDPPELGRMTIELTDVDGGVAAKITTDRQPTAALVEQQLVQLRQSLQDAGVDLKHVQVGFHFGNAHDDQSARQETPFAARNEWTGGRSRSVSRTRGVASSPARGVGQGRLDMRM